MCTMQAPTLRVVRSPMQVQRQHSRKHACATSLQATITRASCSATTRSNVLEWVLKVSWAVAPPTTLVMALHYLLQLRVRFRLARVAVCDRSLPAHHTRVRCSITQRSSVGVQVSMGDWDMKTQQIVAIHLGKWATRCLRCHLVPDAPHCKSRLALNIRAHCSTILQSSVGGVATTANWALALQPPSAMAQARWAIRW